MPMGRYLLSSLVFLTAAFVFFGFPMAAHAQDDSPAVLYNRGLQWGIGPSLLVPSDGGPLGLGLDLDVRYGIETGPFIVAPGGRVAGYFLSGYFVGEAMPTVRLTFPVGFLAPFILGGAGAGWVSNPQKTGVALLGGGGLMVHLGRVLGLGAEVTYQTITGTDFHVVSIGPQILIGF